MYDIAQSNVNEEGFGTEMILYGARDDMEFYDIVNPQAQLTDAVQRNTIKNHKSSAD